MKIAVLQEYRSRQSEVKTLAIYILKIALMKCEEWR